jgi:hypothetical protein
LTVQSQAPNQLPQTTIESPKSQPAVKGDVPTIAREALRSVVLILAYDQDGKVSRQGSGFVVSADGKIATNYHVIEGARAATVKFADGAFYEIEKVVSTDTSKDLAVLKIKTTGREFPFLRLSDSSRVEVGQEVIVIGSPLALEGTVSTGIISGIRNPSDLSLELAEASVFQITAPVSPGSSGGALLNLEGAAIGIPSFGYVHGQNLNFAIPSNEVTALMMKPLVESGGAFPKKSTPPKHPVSPSEMLGSAKTLCVWVTSGNPVLKTEVSSKILQWGKLTLVTDPNDADLILEIVQTGQLNLGTGAGNQATALLRHRESGTELWSKARGGSWAMNGWSNSAVAHGLATDFIKFFDSSTKHVRP